MSSSFKSPADTAKAISGTAGAKKLFAATARPGYIKLYFCQGLQPASR